MKVLFSLSLEMRKWGAGINEIRSGSQESLVSTSHKLVLKLGTEGDRDGVKDLGRKCR